MNTRTLSIVVIGMVLILVAFAANKYYFGNEGDEGSNYHSVISGVIFNSND
jgi:hypothetical protein